MEACARCGAALQPADAHCRSCGAPRTTVGRHIDATQQMAKPMVPATQPMAAQPVTTQPVAAQPASAGQPYTPPPHQQSAASAPAQPRPRPAANHALTAVANEAFTMVKAFEVAFGQPFPGWRAELREPVGPSTGGGKQALQAISIVDQQGHRLAIGSVDSSTRMATLRSHALVAAMHEARFDGDPFLVREADYKTFIDRVSNLLGSMSIRVKLETMAPTPKRRAPEPSRGLGMVWFVAVALAIAVAIAIAIAMT